MVYTHEQSLTAEIKRLEIWKDLAHRWMKLFGLPLTAVAILMTVSLSARQGEQTIPWSPLKWSFGILLVIEIALSVSKNRLTWRIQKLRSGRDSAS